MTFVPVGMMSGVLMVMLAGSIVSPGAAISIAACKAASVLALFHGAAGHHRGIGAKGSKLDRGG